MIEKTLANKSIERLKVIEAEKQILRSKFNESIEALDNEAEQIKGQLKEFYYSLPSESLEETKTLRIYKVGDSKLQEKIQEPEFIRDEKIMIDWAKRNGQEDFVKTKIIESFDWLNLKKEVEVQGDYVTHNGEIVEGVTVKEREPIFEVVIK